jgi:hypothetical protein
LTRRKNTKYCAICRLLKNLSFLKERTSKCLVCEKTFSQVSRNEQVCLACDPYSTPAAVEGTCGLCGTPSDRLLGEHIAVCVGCAQDPSKREVFRASLLKKQKAIKEGTVVIEVTEPEDA